MIVDENVQSLPLDPEADLIGVCGMDAQFERQRAILPSPGCSDGLGAEFRTPRADGHCTVPRPDFDSPVMACGDGECVSTEQRVRAESMSGHAVSQ